MFQKDILITDYVHPSLLSGLESLGYSTTYAPEMRKAEMEIYLPHYKGVVINTRCGISKASMEKAPHLKWIARLGSGLDIIDVDAAKEMGIQVFSAPEGNAQAVAEHAAGMLLCLSNKLINADRQVRQGYWLREENRGWELSGKTIGVIGYGNNGSAFGRLWKGWALHVLAYDKYLNGYGGDSATETTLDNLIESSDIISLHVPLTDETDGMVNAAFLAKCIKGVVLINTSRGRVVNLRDLVESLHSGHVSGACLDVLPHEPPSSGAGEYLTWFQELTELDNVVLSPHVAGWTVESKRKIAEVLVNKIKGLE